MSSHSENKIQSNTGASCGSNVSATELNTDESESNSANVNLMNEHTDCVIQSKSSTVIEQCVVKDIKQSPPQSPPTQSTPSLDTMGGLSQSLNLFQSYQGVNNAGHSNQKSPFLLPAQFYKNLFASAMLQQNKPSDKLNAGQPPFPRNLLFSCSQKSPPPSSSDIENEDKSDVLEQVSVFSAKKYITCLGRA